MKKWQGETYPEHEQSKREEGLHNTQPVMGSNCDQVTRLLDVRPSPNHPDGFWLQPGNGEIPLETLMEAYVVHLRRRTNPASTETVVKYVNSIKSFVRWLQS